MNFSIPLSQSCLCFPKDDVCRFVFGEGVNQALAISNMFGLIICRNISFQVHGHLEYAQQYAKIKAVTYVWMRRSIGR